MTAIMGYADRYAVRPTETIAFKVSCEAASYDVTIVRLRCGDDRPGGPGYAETPVTDATVNGRYDGQIRPIACGSYLRFPPHQRIGGLETFSFAVLIWPTMPLLGEQTILSCWDGASTGSRGVTLKLTAEGNLQLRLAGQGEIVTLTTSHSLASRRWYRVLVTVHPESATLHWEPLRRTWDEPDSEAVSLRNAASVNIPVGRPLLIGAHEVGSNLSSYFNGKIEAPILLARIAKTAELADLLTAGPLILKEPALVAAWDFSRDIPSNVIHDVGPEKINGICVNLPARAVTGACWSGKTLTWTEAEHEYAAIHFHDDDLYDCNWPTDFAWILPAALASGVYAARLRIADGDEEYIPFFVLAPAGKPRSEVAFLASTATYLAYANSHDAYEDPVAEVTHGALLTLSAIDLFLMRRRDLGLSTYDLHQDGSGSFYSSRLRPMLNNRPRQALWSFNADLHIIDWLMATEQGCDVIDDETLHHEGATLLSSYRCLITGSHPELRLTARDGGSRAIPP